MFTFHRVVSGYPDRVCNTITHAHTCFRLQVGALTQNTKKKIQKDGSIATQVWCTRAYACLSSTHPRMFASIIHTRSQNHLRFCLVFVFLEPGFSISWSSVLQLAFPNWRKYHEYHKLKKSKKTQTNPDHRPTPSAQKKRVLGPGNYLCGGL